MTPGGDRLFLETALQLVDLGVGEDCEVAALEEEEEAGGFLELLNRVGGGGEVGAGDDGAVVGEEDGVVVGGEFADGAGKTGVTGGIVGHQRQRPIRMA